jgi:lipopolysaccharide biosynthesis regulator YciM
MIEMQMGFLGEAEQIFKDAALHIHCDSNAYNSLGHLYLKQERNSEALQMFEKAYQLCEDKYKSMMRFNMELSRYVSGSKITDTSFFDHIDYSALIDDDLTRIRSLEANIAFDYNRKEKAFEIWEEMERKGIHDEDSVCYYALALIHDSDINKGISLLKRYAFALNSKKLFNHLIQQFFNYKEIYLNEAVDTLEGLIKNDPGERKYYFELIRGLVAAGEYKRVNELSKRMLHDIGLPKTQEDFFIDGFINYVLKLKDRASYDYERAKMDLPYYDNYLPKD